MLCLSEALNLHEALPGLEEEARIIVSDGPGLVLQRVPHEVQDEVRGAGGIDLASEPLRVDRPRGGEEDVEGTNRRTTLVCNVRRISRRPSCRMRRHGRSIWRTPERASRMS